MVRLVLALMVLASPALAQSTVPVMLDVTDGEMAGCGWGEVVGLDPIGGDGFLAVRSGPGTKHRQLDSLYNGDGIWLCDRRGRWWGVVYSSGSDCGVHDARSRPVPYRGTCRSGWVFDGFVTFIGP